MYFCDDLADALVKFILIVVNDRVQSLHILLVLLFQQQLIHTFIALR